MFTFAGIRIHQLIEDAGGSVSTSWVAQLLQISEEAVKTRMQQNMLIASHNTIGELSFPRFQFHEPNRQLLPWLQELLIKTEPWSPEKVILFLLVRHNPEYSDDTPLTMLKRGELDSVLQLASVYMEQRP